MISGVLAARCQIWRHASARRRVSSPCHTRKAFRSSLLAAFASGCQKRKADRREGQEVNTDETLIDLIQKVAEIRAKLDGVLSRLDASETLSRESRNNLNRVVWIIGVCAISLVIGRLDLLLPGIIKVFIK